MNPDLDQHPQGRGPKFVAGCAALALLIIVIVSGSFLRILARERQAAQYPGSDMISEHNNYSGFPTHFRWDNSYHTADPFNKVYNWYSITFDMGAEARANGNCIYLEDRLERLQVQRTMSVFICGTPEGQLIFVSRSTAVNR